MITINKKFKLVEALLDVEEIKTRELLALGFTSRDIKKLCDEKFLEKKRLGIYSLNSETKMDILYNYSRNAPKFVTCKAKISLKVA